MTTLYELLKIDNLKLLLTFVLVNSIRIVFHFYTTFFVRSKKFRLPPIDNDILLKPAVEVANLIRQGKVKSKDVVKAYLKRVEAVNPKINAIVEINKNALRLAEEVDERVRLENSGQRNHDYPSIHDQPLLGVPISIKDSIAVKGLPFTGGLYARRKTLADEDSTIVANLRSTGAIPFVLTSVPELLMWIDTDNTFVGYTHNPYDLSRAPGGSSGGEAALISSAGSVIGIGSDIAGSLRVPAFRSGIFAHKVTPNVMPRNGIFPVMNDTLSPLFTTGPMCRYACDLIPTLKAAAGDEIKHLNSLDEKVDVSKIKIFYMFQDSNILRPPLQQDLKDALLKVVNYFEETYKVQCVNVYFDEFSRVEEVWNQMFAKGTDFHEDMSNGGPKINLLAEAIKSVFGLSEHTLRSLQFAYYNRFDPNFDESKNERFQRFKEKFINLLGTNGIFLYPTSRHVTPKTIYTLLDYCLWGCTCIFNALGFPVTQCPLGLNKEGLPLGVQVATTPYNDRLSLAVAAELEKAFGGWVPPSTVIKSRK